MTKDRQEVNPDSLAARLFEARDEAGLTQAQLGALVGVGQGQIAKLESGIRKSSTVTIQLAAALHEAEIDTRRAFERK